MRAPALIVPYLENISVRPARPTMGVMFAGAALAAAGAAVVFWALLTEGHAAFNTSSDMAWGLPSAYYLFLLLASSGLSVLASLDIVFGMNAAHPIAKRCVWLAIATLVAGFSVLALEIGQPFRMLWALPFSFQVRSPMWWMGIFYSLDLVLLLVKFHLLHTRDWDSRVSHTVSIVSFVVCICAAGTLGLVFGMMAMRPAWYNPVMPVYFMLTGFVTAIAMILFTVNVTGGRPEESKAATEILDVSLPRLFLVTLLGVFAMDVGRMITGLWSNFEGFEVFSLRVSGPLPLFHIEFWLGLVVPMLLMSTAALRASAFGQLVAAALALLGMLAGRLDLLIIGQQVPLFKGTYFKGVSAQTGFVEYWPSFTEWMLVPFGFGIVLFLYAAGSWLLRLRDAPKVAPGH
jgi:molybdopterin-containing oxidoreductase family membrane subunit